MPDPDLDITAGRVGGGGGVSRPLEKGGAVSKKCFRPFGPQFGLKIREEGAGPGPLPWIRHWKVSIFFAKNPFLQDTLKPNVQW